VTAAGLKLATLPLLLRLMTRVIGVELFFGGPTPIVPRMQWPG
jgi:hypothetical protein